ncbi:hypothetical protein ACOSP7_001526 [Xanthoceras sorbifolium]|uniref:Phytocyanin domain-containing protein n=1 Tax=Xanthoceras sorbifolium TaxID=99658 RepID=A0ABQ8GWT7_9ROSI|nr:hypothetical protein JRO89_XSUnG0228500 [Xanthoceras sorbifolium]
MGLVMRSSTAVIFMMMMMSTLCGISMSAEYKVDFDSLMDMMDDHDLQKPVNLGDSIILVYNKTIHSLIEVSLQDYAACNAASPIANYTSGFDIITFNRAGNYYFICGFHCKRGEKMSFTTDYQIPSPSIMTTKSSNSASSPSTSSTSGRKIAPQNKS